MSSPEPVTTRPPPIVAILRGVKPDEVVAIAKALVDAGIRAIEVPLNSPEPLESIRRSAKPMATSPCAAPAPC
jgi:2-dehydro-3-deoxyphosphogalactonate aldolase